MTIKKYLQSCILLEKEGKRLLVDPGRFSFIEQRVKPEDIGPVDAIVLTHSHPDHYYPAGLKGILELRAAPIMAHPEIGALLEQEGLAWQSIEAGNSRDVAGFHIAAHEAPHEHLPIPCPHNLAFVVDDKILLPGDSYRIAGLDHCDVVALPVAGPWSRLDEAVDFAKKLKPRIVIPIHDWVIKDVFLERIYDMCRTALEQEGITFHPLSLGDTFEVEN